MKYLIQLCLSMALAVLTVSCDFIQAPQQVKVMQSEKDSLTQVTIDQMAELVVLQETFKKVSQKLDDINGNIQVNTDDESLIASRDRLIQQLENLQTQMNDKQTAIDELQKKYGAALTENKSLKKLVDAQKKEIQQCREHIAVLEKNVAEQKANIATMAEDLNATRTNLEQAERKVDEQSSQIEAQNRAIEAHERKAYTAYYIVASKSRLKELSIIEGGVFNRKHLSSKGFDTRAFQTISDFRQVKEIPLSSKSAEVLSTMPEHSYEIVSGFDRNLVLRILDAELFWSQTKYLVVKI